MTIFSTKNQTYLTDTTYLHNCYILHVSSILQILSKIRQIFGIKSCTKNTRHPKMTTFSPQKFNTPAKYDRYLV